MSRSVRSPIVTGDSGTTDRRIPLPWLITPIVVLALMGTVADILGPKLIVEHPQLQMFLNPRNRYMILAAATVEAVPFFIIGFTRLVLTDPLGFLLGRQYGDAALKWAGEKMGDEGKFVRRVERIFGKAAPVIVVVAPNLYMCILAGASGMRTRVFITLNVLGTIGRLVLFRIAGHAFRDELLSLVDWIGRNQKWLIMLSLVVVALQSLRSRKRGTLETVSEIEAEIEANEAELEADDQPDRP
jgi:membrane protein DedA with SNARE-associated domain